MEDRENGIAVTVVAVAVAVVLQLPKLIVIADMFTVNGEFCSSTQYSPSYCEKYSLYIPLDDNDFMINMLTHRM